jgi:hypothetical protein
MRIAGVLDEAKPVSAFGKIANASADGRVAHNPIRQGCGVVLFEHIPAIATHIA